MNTQVKASLQGEWQSVCMKTNDLIEMIVHDQSLPSQFYFLKE